MQNNTSQNNAPQSKLSNIDLPLTIISVSTIVLICFLLTVFPTQSTEISNSIFQLIIESFGSIYLWLGLIAVGLNLAISLSKYGNIKLGSQKTKFSRFQYFAMMASAGLGAATLYWGFLEVLYYYTGPPSFAQPPQSQHAAEWALTININHYGLVSWGFYALASLPLCYLFYVRKDAQLRLSAVCQAALGPNIISNPIRKVIDFLTIIVTIGAVTITLGLALPVISNAIVVLTGLEASLSIDIAVVSAIALVFIVSSAIGIEKGLGRLSSANIWLALAFITFIFISGPSSFIVSNLTSSLGRYFQNFIVLNTWMDPIGEGGFPQAWTIFYWSYWLAYTPPMVLFITRISKGQRLKDVLLITMFGGTLGCAFFLGILGGYSLDAQLSGAIDGVSYIKANNGPGLIWLLLNSLPLPLICVFVYVLSSILFMATTMDGFSFSIASATTKKLDINDNPSTTFRLFWCVVLTLMPLIMVYIKAPLDTLKTVSLLVGTPFLAIFSIMAWGLLKWLKQDFGTKSAAEIESYNHSLPQ